MVLKAIPLILSALTLVDGSLLRRNQGVAGAEFGRVFGRVDDSKEKAKQSFREQAQFRRLYTPFDDGMSMLDGSMSMPYFDGSMSMPLDVDISRPLEVDMSRPLDETKSLDFTTSMPAESADTEPAKLAPVCDESLPSITIPTDFEVQTRTPNDAVSFLTGILSTAIAKDFTLCPDSSRKLSDKERKLEESTVRGVKILSVAEVDGETCFSEDLDCHVVHVENKVFYVEGTSSDAARTEFLEKLFARLAEVDGVRVREPASFSSSDLSTKVNDITDKDSTSEGVPAAQTALIVVLSVAAASIAFVVVQRKFATNKNADDNSVASEETMPNTAPLLVTV